ncbi:LuxR C-terminal-related transcriptional regulator [Streptomyces sp. NPDC006923]|uniref:helix-turn-helix transcriptional regulator n=1 Tax=Streptomyces sp. NPDC006923 TaxID=3155355 RepID=UPI0033C49502
MQDFEGPVSLGVVASDPITNAGVRAYLRSRTDMYLVPESQSWEADVIIALEMEVTEETLRRMESSVKERAERHIGIMLVTDSIQEKHLVRAIALGLVSVLPRSSSTLAHIGQSLLRISGGEADLPAPLVRSLIQQVQAINVNILEPPGLTPSGLTRREADVLRLLADGYDTAAMAERLRYSERTIKNILRGVIERHNLRNRTHAVAYALRSGAL